MKVNKCPKFFNYCWYFDNKP